LNVLAFLPTGILKEFHQVDIVAQATQENADHDYFYHLFMIFRNHKTVWPSILLRADPSH